MKDFKFFSIIVLIGTLLISLPVSAPGQAYPDKPITVYCSYAAGATTDLTTRSLAEGVEKMLGVPVEDKVAAILRATIPDLPMPQIMTRPGHLAIKSTAASK